MNQITMHPLGDLTAVDPARTNQRALAKQRTREKILAAAKALFAERGYEGATIRDIAKSAGMSTGAVFASFIDKSDLFTEIAEAEQADLHRALRAAQEGLEGEAGRRRDAGDRRRQPARRTGPVPGRDERALDAGAGRAPAPPARPTARWSPWSPRP